MKYEISVMKKAFFLIMMSCCTFMQSAHAQSVATNYKGVNDGNPISPSVFCADPTALEYNGRLYVYGSNDHQSFKKRGQTSGIDYGDIKSLVVFSTADMVNWTFHGTIDVQKLCSTWTGNPWYKGFMNSWAPSVTWRATEEGKDEFFLYFANTSHGVGVLTADSPIGPWKSPLKESMINRDTPGALPNSAIFDPGVVIDENGIGWITFGGLDPTEGGTDIQPNNARIAKLKPSMIALDGSALKIPAPYHFEANELNIIGGKYVFTYCSNWANRNDNDWNKYISEHNINVGKPGACTMCYMVTDSPTVPNSWVNKGVYGPPPGTSPNNHSHLHKFQGNYYHIYHSGALFEGMKSAGVVNSNNGGYRSICVNKATVNEETQTINTVSLNLEGVEAICNLNPYELQQAETMATCGGIGYDDFTNITKNGRINNLGNEVSQDMQVKMQAGSWIMLRKVDFGENGASRFSFRAKGSGALEIRFGRKTAQAAVRCEFSTDDFADHVFEVDTEKFKNVRNIFIVFPEANNVQFDSWQFTEVQTNGIDETELDENTNTQRYDLSGRRLPNTNNQSGIVIEQYVDKQGVKRSRKRTMSRE